MNTPISKLESLAGLIRTDGADTKPALLRVLTDFYIQKPVHSPEENRHFTELALRLISEVDKVTRKDIARRLADHGGVPLVVLQRLSADLCEDLEQKTPVSPTAGTAQPSVRETTPPVASVPTPSVIPSADRTAAMQFSEKFFAADSLGRRTLLRELDTGAAVTPHGLSVAQAATTCQNLESAALRSRPYEFVREMERALEISRPIAQLIVNDLSGEPMLVISKALDMPIDVVQRILLLVNPAVGNSVRRVFDLSELYTELSSRAALRLISLWRHTAPVPAEEATLAPLPGADTARRIVEDTFRFKFTQTPPPKKQDQRAS